MAAGLGPIGYVFAIFHLLMHGVFKAGLFLGAGSVMHGMKDNVDMRRYGALRALMLVTSTTFIICYLAIIGIPPFDGFFSKDDIIHASFERNPIIGILAMLVAGLTGFYMTRMVAMTFFGKARWEDDVHPHESPKVMTIPLILLAIGATFGGIALLYWGNIETWLEPVTGIVTVELAFPSWVYEVSTLVLVLIGAAIGWVSYARRDVPIEAPRGSWLTRAARQELYGNQVNDVLVVQPTFYTSRWLVWFDNKAVDGFVNGSAAFVGGLSGRMRRYQTGFVRSYALSMVGGAVLVVLALVLVRAS
jgi:NADH-quinone oxidoreductase subunit L